MTTSRTNSSPATSVSSPRDNVHELHSPTTDFGLRVHFPERDLALALCGASE